MDPSDFNVPDGLALAIAVKKLWGGALVTVL